MRGLLRKDAELLIGNIRVYASILVIAVIYLVMGNGMELLFVPYFTYVSGTLALTTLSYDDYDHGMSYLMTMPVGRKTYVREKYLLGLLLTFGGWILSVVIACILGIQRGSISAGDWQEWAVTCMIYLLVICIMLMVTLPAQIRFGAENSRVVVIGMALAIFAVIFIAAKIMKANSDIIDFDALLTGFLNHFFLLAMLAALCLIIITVAISYGFSVKFMEKKEF